jgi:microcystin-dependent protein
MGQPFIGEIRMFGGNFAPAGWAFCDGQTMAISENDTLFNLIGTTYGGDGQETFNLPDLQGRVPIHMGTDPSGNTYTLAEAAGTESVTLTTQQIPIHSHAVLATAGGQVLSPSNTATLAQATGGPQGVEIFVPPANLVALNAASVGPSGGSQPHENCQPFLVINFILSLYGIYPSPT